jgi:hypothetical protein
VAASRTVVITLSRERGHDARLVEFIVPQASMNLSCQLSRIGLWPAAKVSCTIRG